MKSINYLVGDATIPQGDGPKIIAHCANDIGGWGAGFVLAISKRWPQPEAEYRAWAQRASGRLNLGDVQFVSVGHGVTIANIIGQRNVGFQGAAAIRYGALAEGLVTVGIRAQITGESVHMPRIGCGLAGGNWDAVEPIIKETLCARDINVFVYDLLQNGGAQ